jgi:hypothetical protein
VPPTVRASESRKRRLDAGVKRIELLLESAAVADLEALINHFKISRVEVISKLLMQAARRVQSKQRAP